MSGGRRLARRSGLALLALVIALCASEGLFRLAMVWKPSLQNLNPPTLVEDPATEHWLLPGITTRYISPEGEFDSRVIISRQGFHDHDRAMAKAPETYRVVVVGDSFVEGLHVPVDGTFASLLETRLRRDVGPHVEVINAGVSGMSPLLEYLALRDKLLAWQPDLVVLCFFMNDVSEDQAYRDLVAFADDGRPLRLARTTSRTAFVPGTVKIFIKQHWRLGMHVANLYRFPGGFARYRIYTEGTASFTPGEPPGDIFAILREPETPAVAAAWSFTTAALDHVVRLLTSRGVRLILVAIPAPNQVSEREWTRGRTVWRLDGAPSLRPQAILADWAAARGVPMLDLVPALHAWSESPLYFPYDGHFTAAGHRATADALARFLVEQPWMARR